MPRIPQQDERGLLSQNTQKSANVPRGVIGGSAYSKLRAPTIDTSPIARGGQQIEQGMAQATNAVFEFIQQKELGQMAEFQNDFLNAQSDIASIEETSPVQKWQEGTDQVLSDYRRNVEERIGDYGGSESLKKKFVQFYSEQESQLKANQTVRAVRKNKQNSLDNIHALNQNLMANGNYDQAKVNILQAVDTGLFTPAQGSMESLRISQLQVDAIAKGSMAGKNREGLDVLSKNIDNGAFNVKYHALGEDGLLQEKTLKLSDVRKSDINQLIERQKTTLAIQANKASVEYLDKMDAGVPTYELRNAIETDPRFNEVEKKLALKSLTFEAYDKRQESFGKVLQAVNRGEDFDKAFSALGANLDDANYQALKSLLTKKTDSQSASKFNKLTKDLENTVRSGGDIQVVVENAREEFEPESQEAKAFTYMADQALKLQDLTLRSSQVYNDLIQDITDKGSEGEIDTEYTEEVLQKLDIINDPTYTRNISRHLIAQNNLQLTKGVSILGNEYQDPELLKWLYASNQMIKQKLLSDPKKALSSMMSFENDLNLKTKDGSEMPIKGVIEQLLFDHGIVSFASDLETWEAYGNDKDIKFKPKDKETGNKVPTVWNPWSTRVR